MSVIDIESLLQEVGPETPTGENLEYDAAFTEMERVAAGREAQQMGDSVVEGEEPDWKAVKKAALELFGRTKDLRVAVYLVRSLLVTDGLPGYRDGLEVLVELLKRYWEPMHPQLDPDDDNDPTMRVNILASLCDADTNLRLVREAPLVSARTLGRFSLRDVEVANGTVPYPEGQDEPPPEMPMIEGAFLECDIEELQAVAGAVAESLELVRTLDATLTDLVGAGQAASFTPLLTELKSASTILSEQLARRGVGEAGGEDAAGGGAEGGPKPITGEVQTREDVVRLLDKICDYYNRHEPSSPIPLLLRRAKRLVSKSFMEIIRDMAPSGAAEAEAIGGVDSEQQ